jgi:hypothetical protein
MKYLVLDVVFSCAWFNAFFADGFYFFKLGFENNAHKTSLRL